MLRLEAIPAMHFFNVFDGDRQIGTVSLKEIYEVFDGADTVVHLGGPQAERMQLFLKAKANNQSLFEEALEEAMR